MTLHYVATTSQGDSRQANVLAILLHGGALSSSMYRTLLPHLTIPSIAVDLPGHGESLQSGPFTFSKSTELLKSLIDMLQNNQEDKSPRIILVGISLGGQAVLDFVLRYPELISTAIVSGATIHPPDDIAAWEMPHMPEEQSWLNLMTKDINIIGFEAANALQKESFAFTLDYKQDSTRNIPPLLICIGENDVAMAKRDFSEIVQIAKQMNDKSEGKIITGGWHNHSIDIPEIFAKIINSWVDSTLSDNHS